MLPPSALSAVGEHGLGLYVHLPSCAARRGHRDFNTYTPRELDPGPGSSRAASPASPASPAAYVDAAVAEVGLARGVLAEVDRPLDTVFFGGGTPTLLPPADLARVLGAARDAFGLADDVEVTTESNPDSVTPADLRALRDAGFTRVSFGMQSSVHHVLRVLDRSHDPDRVPQAVQWARDAGFDQVSLDLIY